jgi:protein TonB
MQQPEHLLRAQAPPFSSRRFISAGIVIVFHVLVILGFASGLAQHLITKLPEEFKAEVVKEQIPVKPPPPPPPPELVKPPPPFVPPPTIVIQQDAPVNTITTTSVKPPPEVKPSGITAPALIAGGAKCQQSYYPQIAIRLNQEGTTTVAVHVAADGSVSGVDVADSSGHDSLDQAAIKCITNAWRFKPALENGTPVAQTKAYKIVWRLQ